MPEAIGEAIVEIVGWFSEAGAAELGSTAFYTAAGEAVSYATLVGYAVTIGGSIAYSSSQNARMRNALRNANLDQGRNVMERDPVAARRLIYGEVPTAGPILFMATTGTKNEFLHVIMAVAGHEVNQLGTVYFDDFEEVPLDGSGDATGKYAGVFHCEKFTGTPTQGYCATLVAATGLWTANHRLKRIAYLYLRFKFDPNLFPNGMPLVRVMTQGKKLRDTRVTAYTKTCTVAAGNENIVCADLSGLTVGMYVDGPGIPDGSSINSLGVGTFHIDQAPTVSTDPVTLTIYNRTWSGNAALCTTDYLNDPTFGKGIPWPRINTTAVAAEANVCDETIVTNTGTEPRYVINGTATSDQNPDQVLSDLVSAMAGKVTDTGGIWSVLAGAYRTVTAPVYTDDDLLGPITVQCRQSMRDTFSGVKGTYISPDNQWQPADFPPIKNDTYMAQDGGIRRWKDIGLPFTTSSPTSQRLAKVELERARQQIVVTALYKLKAFQVACGDTIQITREVLGWTAKTFEVVEWSLQQIQNGNNISLGIYITARETAPGVWDWADGEETTVDLAPNTDLPDPTVVPTPSSPVLLTDSTTSIFQADGTFVPRLKVSWNTPNNIYVEQGGLTILEYKKHADSAWLTWGQVRGDVLLDFITDVQVGTALDVRIVHQNAIGVRGAYATTSNYTIAGDTAAPAAPGGSAASTGTGKSVRLTWTPNTEADLLGYRIYRNTVNNVSTATLLAFIAATTFVDVNVSLGTQYFYWLSAVDDTNNESAKTGSVNATPTGVATGGTVAAPTAATKTAEGTYTATDGSIFSFLEFSVPALPAGAVGQNLSYKKSSDASYIVGAELYNTGTQTGVRIPDLSPGVAYDVATQAWNSFGDVSTVVIATSSPFTAPTKTTASADPTGFAGHTPGSTWPIPASFINSLSGGVPASVPGLTVTWTRSVARDVAFIEFGWDVVGSSNVTPPANWRGNFTDNGQAILYPGGFTTYLWCRTTNTSGVTGTAFYTGVEMGALVANPAALGSASSAASTSFLNTTNNLNDVPNAGTARSNLGLGSAATQSTGTFNQTANNLSDVPNAGTARSNLGLGSAATQSTSAFLQPGNNLSDVSSAGTARKNLGIWIETYVPASLSGGASTESVNIDITAAGCGSAPSAALVQCTSDMSLAAQHDFSAGGNSATNLVVFVQDRTGGTISAGLRRFTVILRI